VTDRPLDVVRAGRVPYGTALAWQRRLAADRIAGRQPHDLLLLVEHPPVITLGRSARGAHVLRPAGVEVVEVERGGDVTYHGPGQLVGYPILDLAAQRPDLHWYLRTLEEALIRGLARLGIPADRRAGFTGVWTRNRKIASIGVHVKQWVTWHGFALNVTTDLAAFERIVPCGITGVEMTSVARELEGDGGRGTPPRSPTVAGGGSLWDHAQAAVVEGFEAAFGYGAETRELAPPPVHSG
jgi:lipoyl(octanoyl) transferase